MKSKSVKRQNHP